MDEIIPLSHSVVAQNTVHSQLISDFGVSAITLAQVSSRDFQIQKQFGPCSVYQTASF